MKNFIFTLALAFAGLSAHSQTDVVWIGGPSGDWNDGNNWDAGHPPFAGDNALVLTVPAIITVLAGNTAVAQDVTLYSGSTLELEGDANFRDLSVSSLNISAASTLTITRGHVDNLVNHGRIQSKVGSAFTGLIIQDYMDNYGEFEVSDGGNGIHGLYITGTAHNRSGGSIFVANTGFGVSTELSSGEFYNHAGATITLETSLGGIVNGTLYSSYFENSGDITVTYPYFGAFESINNRGHFVNKNGGHIISAAGYEGIVNSGDFENEQGGIITVYTARKWGFINRVYSGGSAPTLTNAGIITLNNANTTDDEGCFGLESTDFTNTSTGILTINNGNTTAYYSDNTSTTNNAGTIDIQGIYSNYGLSVAGTFGNASCGTVLLGTNTINLSNGATLNNAGWLDIICPSAQSFDGEIVNNGGIGDMFASLPSSGMTNNRIIVQKTTGTACENHPLANALEVGGLTGFTVVGWYTDASCTTSAGNYNFMNNTFTPNSNAVGLASFYVKIGGSGCDYVFSKIITGGVQDEAILYQDSDGDGYGNPNVSINDCTPLAGYVVNSGDCDDNDPLEFHNQEWFEDEDGDGYGHGPATVQCERPNSDWYVDTELIATGGDCDDDDPLEFPGQTWYKDHDDDGYSDGTSVVGCNRPPDYFLDTELIDISGDCNDINPFEYPGQTWYKDTDFDDYSDGTFVVQCQYPGAGWYRATQLTATSGDCDNNDPIEFPGQIWHLDNDGDAYSNGTSITQCLRPAGNYFAGILSGDCNDADPTVNPGEQDLCDNIDNNCNGITDEAPCGTSCPFAKPIDALPFIYAGTTLNSENDYHDDDACLSTWMTAEDYVLTYTPPVDQVVRMKLTNTGVSQTGYYTHAMFVLNGCPNAGGSCLYSVLHGTNGQNDPIYLETVELQGGVTYFIVLDNHGTFQPNYSFIFEMDLPEGNICANAIPLAAGSTVSGTTQLLGNDYSWSDACNSDWMTGNDVVYKYTATAGEVARIKLEYDGPTPASGYYAPSVFVLDGCPDAGANCLYSGFYTSPTNSDVWIETVQFPSAGTYYIVVASHGTFNPWYNYTLTIDNPLGNICENAVPIGSLPYAASNQTTCLFGNDYNSTDACNSSWMNGHDFVYELIPDMSGTVDISLSNLSDDYTAIFFLNGCPDDPGSSCAMATNSGMGNFVINDQAVTMGNTYYVVISSFATFTSCFNYDISMIATPLPVELVRFTVEKQGESMALLHWETASEADFSHYEIERSTDGTAWAAIGKTTAHGGTETAGYSYADPLGSLLKTSAVRQFYYRLKMVDVDGSFELSPVESVRFEGEVTGFTVFPNPTSGELFLRPSAAIEGVVVVELTDAAGTPILQKTIDFQQAETAAFGEGLLPGAGFYCMKISKDAAVIWQGKVVVTGY